MSLELRDVRARVTVETDAALEAVARITGRDRSEILREVMHRWALEQVSIANVLHDRLRAEGITAALEGVAAQQGEKR